MKLLNYADPYPDELLYAWLYRLAMLNGLSSRNVSDSIREAAEIEIIRPKVAKDYPVGINLIWKRFGEYFVSEKTPLDFVDNTPLRISMMIHQKGKQYELSQYALNGNKYRNRTQRDVNTIRICPLCAQDKPYIRVWHCCYDVTVCALHKIKLFEIDEEQMDSWPEMLKGIEQVPIYDDKEMSYSKWIYDAYQAPMNIDVSSLIENELVRRGYVIKTKKSEAEKERNDALIRSLFSDDLRTPLQRLLHRQSIRSEYALHILASLYKQYSQFEEAVHGYQELYEEGKAESINVYECMKCGTEYASHYLLGGSEYSCPECRVGIPKEDVYEKELTALYGGEYKVKDDFEGYNNPVVLKHENCGRCKRIKPAHRIFDGMRCQCIYSQSLGDIQKRIDSVVEGFTLLKKSPIFGGSELTIRHNGCGKEFIVNMSAFFSSPGCRECDPHFNPFGNVDKEIERRLGPDYILKEYYRETKEITMTHTVCQTDTVISRRSLRFKGARCRLCSVGLRAGIFVKENLEKSSDGFYKVIGEEGSKFQIEDGEGNINAYDKERLFNDLLLPEPKILIHRKHIPEIPPSDATKMYLIVRDWCVNHSVWIRAEHPEYEDLFDTRTHAFRYLIENNLIKTVVDGVFAIGEVNVSDYVRERFLGEGENVRGIFLYESAAYALGLIEIEPAVVEAMEYSQSTARIKHMCQGKKVIVRRTTKRIGPENIDAYTGISLISYLVRHPEDEQKVLEYIRKKRINKYRIELYLDGLDQKIKKKYKEIFY